MFFPPELHTDELPAVLNTCVGITGVEPWLSRAASLAQQLRETQLLGEYFAERHALEVAFAKIFANLQKSGQLLSPMEDPACYRLYVFMTMVARVYERLSSRGQRRLRGMLVDGLQTDKGLLGVQHEMTTAAHLMRRHCDVEFHDLETGGGFDFLAKRAGAAVEVECKMVSGDLGRQMHRKRVLELQERLQRVVTTGGVAAQRGGILVEVTIPNRLGGNRRQHQSIADLVRDAIATGDDVSEAAVAMVKLRRFEIQGTLFDCDTPPTFSVDDLARFVEQAFGIENPHLQMVFSARRSVRLVVIRSAKRDDVLHGLFRQLRDTAKGQFSRTRPGVLSVQFYDLTADQLLEIAQADTTDRAKATGLQLATSSYLNSEKRAHIHTVVYRSHGAVSKRSSLALDRVTTTVSEDGAAYVFMNHLHPLHADARYALFASR